MFTGIKGMEDSGIMDVEITKSRNAPQPKNKTNKIPKETSTTDKQLLKENNILLHALIMQNKIHFEYNENTRISSNTLDRKATRSALDKLYTSTNTQLEDKTLHIPMTSFSYEWDEAKGKK